MGNMEDEAYYDENIIIEDTEEPFSCFSIRFIEETREADARDMDARVQEPSETNH